MNLSDKMASRFIYGSNVDKLNLYLSFGTITQKEYDKEMDEIRVYQNYRLSLLPPDDFFEKTGFKISDSNMLEYSKWVNDARKNYYAMNGGD